MSGCTYAVPEPVGRGGQGNTTGANGQGVDLADNDPGTGAPSTGKEEDVDTDECNHGRKSLRVVAISHTKDGDDELADDHAQSTPQQQRTTTDLLDGVEGEGGGKDIDDGGDHAQQERVVDATMFLLEKVGEEASSKVEDKVDTSPPVY